MQTHTLSAASSRTKLAAATRLSEWSFLESTGDRVNNEFYSSSAHNFIEVNGAVPGGILGAKFTTTSTAALSIPHMGDLYTGGFAVALTFMMEGVPNPNGETLIKAWVTTGEKTRYPSFFGSDDAALIFAIQLDASRRPYFFVSSDGTFGNRDEILLDSDTGRVMPGVEYFLLANYKFGEISITMGSLHGGLTKTTDNTATGIIADKTVSIVVGAQEIGRTPDPEPPHGYIKRVGLFNALTNSEINQIAYEYGMFGYGESPVITGAGLLHSHEVYHPQYYNALTPTVYTIASYRSSHALVTKAFLADYAERLAIDPTLKIKRRLWDGTAHVWTIKNEAEVLAAAGDFNHSIIHYKDNDLSKPMLTMMHSNTNQGSDYEDTNVYGAKFAIES